MQARPARATRNRRLVLAAALALAVGCVGPASQPSATEPQTAIAPPPTPAPTPTPTPLPQLLLMGDASAELHAALQGWAEAHGWALRAAAGSGPDPEPHTAAIVLVGSAGGAALDRLAGSALPVVAAGVAGAAPGERLSVVGEAGARHDQAGFLAGLLAGLVTRTGQVGLIEDLAHPHASVYSTAYLHGLRYVCVRCTLVELEAPAVGADALRAKRVDVVGVVPGATAGTAAASLAGAGFWLVLVDQPAEPFAAGEVAGRVVFAQAPLVIQALEGLLAGEAGRAWTYSAQSDGLRLVDLNAEAISPGRQRLLLAAQESLRSGFLDPGMDRSAIENS